MNSSVIRHNLDRLARTTCLICFNTAIIVSTYSKRNQQNTYNANIYILPTCPYGLIKQFISHYRHKWFYITVIQGRWDTGRRVTVMPTPWHYILSQFYYTVVRSYYLSALPIGVYMYTILLLPIDLAIYLPLAWKLLFVTQHCLNPHAVLETHKRMLECYACTSLCLRSSSIFFLIIFFS